MTVPVQKTINRNRWYVLPDGTKLPSVTTVLGTALNKPALPGWAAKVVAEEAMAELPKLVRMSRGQRAEATKWLKGRPYSQRDEAAAAGTKAHDLAESYVLGKPYEVPGPDTPLGLTLGQFIRWMDDFKPHFEATEATVVNRTIGYAGTLDALAFIPALGEDRLLVVDYKTSRTGPYPEWALQIAAYANAEEMWLPDGTSVSMPQVKGAAVLRLRPEFYALHEVTADLDVLLDRFAAARDIATWALDATEESPFGGEMSAA